MHAPVWQTSPASSSTIGQHVILSQHNIVFSCGIAFPAAAHRVWLAFSKFTTVSHCQRGTCGSVFEQAPCSCRLVMVLTLTVISMEVVGHIF